MTPGLNMLAEVLSRNRPVSELPAPKITAIPLTAYAEKRPLVHASPLGGLSRTPVAFQSQAYFRWSGALLEASSFDARSK